MCLRGRVRRLRGMTDWLQALLLGTVQGLTEFLPVSSSGHLVLLQQWLGEDFFLQADTLVFDLVLHVGTLLPVLWFYRDELLGIVTSLTADTAQLRSEGPWAWLRGDPHRWMAALVVTASVPTAIVGLTLQDQFESLFHSADRVAMALLVTGAIVFSTRFRSGGSVNVLGVSLGQALLLGFAQGFAITPGISRSGTTIAVALFLGLDRELAARFSFLVSIPAILGALLLMTTKGLSLEGAAMGPLVLGFFSSMVVGYGALVFLVALVRKGGLHHFAWYVWPVAIVTLIQLA